MRIQKIHIDAFGCLCDRTFELNGKIHVIEGKNESGKSTLAEFIKFCLFGFQPRSADRKKYLSEQTGTASGWIELLYEGKTYRVSRKAAKSGATVNETCSVADLTDHLPTDHITSPGEYFTGFSRELFSQTAYISQLASGKPEGGEIGVQIDNMFSSGDENLNIKRALKKLDEMRRVYGKKDGRLALLERRIGEREEQLERSKKQNEEILNKEISLAKAEKDLKKAEDMQSENKKTLDHYRALRKLEIFDRLHEQENELTALEQAQTTLREEYTSEEFEPTSGYFARLGKLKEDQLLYYREMKSSQDQYAAIVEEQVREKGKRDTFDYDGEEEKLHSSLRKKGSMLVFGIVALVLSILLLAASVFAFLKWDSANALRMVLPAMAFVFVLSAVVFFAMFAKHSAAVKAILHACHAKDETDFLRKKSQAEQQAAKDAFLNERLDVIERELDVRKKAYIATYRAVLEELSKINIDCREPSELDGALETAMVDVRRYLDQMNDLERRIEHTEARLSDLVEQLADDDEDELRQLVSETAPEMELAEAEKNERFYSAQIESLKKRKQDLMLDLASLKSGFVPPSELYSELESLQDSYQNDKRKHEALRLAFEVLEKSASDIRMDLLPSLSQITTDIVGGTTEGRYISIGISDAFVPNCVSEDSQAHTMDYVSSGTQDLIYLAMRVSLVQYLSGQQESLLVFDESFARMDDGRMKRFFAYLKEQFSGQILMLTNNSREANLLEGIVPFEKIEL